MVPNTMSAGLVSFVVAAFFLVIRVLQNAEKAPRYGGLVRFAVDELAAF
jgi:hypothetical protein